MRRFACSIVAALSFATTGIQVSAQTRATVAINQLDDTTGSGLAESFSTMLETAISTTGKLTIIERENLKPLVREKRAVKSGLVRGNPSAPLGGFAGVDYLIYGTITSVTVSENTTGLIGGIGLMLFKGGKGTGCSALVNLEADIKLTDAQSGEIRYSSRVSQRENVAIDCGETNKNVDYNPLIRSAARKIALELVTSIYPMQVANSTGDGFIMINYGSDALALGTGISIYQKGQGFTDPATGELLGSDDILLGSGVIVESNPKFSKAKLVGSKAKGLTIPVGSIVRVVRPPDSNGKKR